MSKNIIRNNIHSSIAKSILNEAISRSTRYYFAYGKSKPWNLDENPDEAHDTLNFENEVRRNMIFAEEILPDDVCLLVNRINWVSGSIYDSYDQYDESFKSNSGATSLEESLFYVLTDEFNVYKCIDNNNGNSSNIKPTGQSVNTFTTGDGYVWKYMYSIHPYLQNKFLTSIEMPVINAASSSYFSSGMLEQFEIVNFGTGYKANVLVNGTVISDTSDYYKLKTSIDMRSQISIGDYIAVNSQVRIVSTISATEISVKSSEAPVYAIKNSSIYKLNTWLDLYGDGFSESNPYVLTSINVVNGGSGYISSQDVNVLFSNPEIQGGVMPKATATVVNGVITKITILECGYGYKKAPVITIQGLSGGFGCIVKPVVTKSSGYLEPIIDSSGQIVGILPLDRGLGYTNSNIIVRRINAKNPALLSTYIDAKILGKTSFGLINSTQFNVEMAAIPGAIHHIKVINHGSLYKDPKIIIEGDGTGAVAIPTVVGGRITKITMTNVGKNYTYASVTISDVTGTKCSLRPVMSPPGGHGRSVIDELFAKTVAFRNSKKEWKINGNVLNLDLRQISLIKSIREFNSPLYFKNYSGSFCFKFNVNLAQYQVMQPNTEIKIYKTTSSRDYIRALVIMCSTTEIIAKAIDQDDESLKIGNYVRLPTNEFILINNLEKPDIDFQSGDLIFVDNRVPIKPTTDQSVTVITRLKT